MSPSDDVQTLTFPDGRRRLLVRYDDFDGISLIADRNALLTRYRDHDLATVKDEDLFTASVAANPTTTLVELANAGEVLSWGTHQSPGTCMAVVSLTPFLEEELAQNGVKSSLLVGCLELTGDLYVGGWHTFTYGCDYRHGELDCARVELPPGRYRVVVHRPFRADEAGEGVEGPAFLILLERVESRTCETLVEVPGADGWF
jgi:hypothetical protein